MRRVKKGRAPKAVYGHWTDALPDLVKKIGSYCSYCEMDISNMLTVDHVIPRDKGGEPLKWSNFLIGCLFCNSCKQATNSARSGYVWPDKDDTNQYFEYLYYFVLVNSNLSRSVQKKTMNTIVLTGLDRNPANNNVHQNDQRWKRRMAAWGKAHEYRTSYLKRPSVSKIKNITDFALAVGFYSVWVTVFSDIPVITAALHKAFPGSK